MKPSQADHDTLAFRLAGILLKLNLGEVFSCETLAEEFKVSERTTTVTSIDWAVSWITSRMGAIGLLPNTGAN